MFWTVAGAMALGAPATGIALGLGEIHVQSHLNEPLRGTIPVTDLPLADIDSLVVRAAPSAAYDRAGLDRVDYISTLRFEIVEQGGRPHIQVLSDAPAREPFLNILVDARARTGALQREYTVLLDPPGYALAPAPAPAPVREPAAVSRAPEPVRPAAPVPAPVRSQTQPASPPAAATPAPAAASAVADAPTPRGPAPTPAAVSGVADAEAPTFFDPTAGRELDPELLDSLGVLSARGSTAATASPTPAATGSSERRAAADGSYTVQRGETLWRVATNARPDPSLTMDQVQLAIYRANPSAFVDGDPTRIQSGARLRIPSAQQIAAIDVAEATRELAGTRSGRAVATVAAAPSTPAARSASAPAASRAPVAEPEEEAFEEPPMDAGQPDISDTRDDLGAGEAIEEPVVDTLADPVSPDEAELPSGEVPEALGDDASGESTGAGASSETDTRSAVDVAPASQPSAAASERPARASSPPAPVEAGGAPWRLLLILLGAVLLLVAALLYLRRRRQEAAEMDAAETAVLAAVRDAEDETPADAPVEPYVEGDLERTQAISEAEALQAAGLGAAGVIGGDTISLGEEEPDDTADPSVSEIEATMRSTSEQPRRTTPDSDEFDITSQFEAQTMQIDLDGGDPVAEADFHLAYGLYDEAALLLREAAEKQPERADVRLKLAETYFAAGKQVEFLEVADGVKNELADADRQKLILMAQQIAPGTSLAQSEASASAPDEAEIDFPLESATSPVADAQPEQGFDVVAAPAEADDGRLDFDLGEPEVPPAGTTDERAAQNWNDNGLDIDLESMTPPVSTPPETGATQADAGDRLDFDLDAPFETVATPSGGGDFDELRLEAPPSDENLDELARELGDFDFDAGGGQLDAPPGGSLALDDFDLDTGSADTAPAVADGDEAATKLDLARAYIDMGDTDMAQALLAEVEAQGSEAQQAEARELLGSLG